MPFITPITNRTQVDVDHAMQNQNSTTDLKGAFNISDANRIIDNTKYLRDILESYGYIASFTEQAHFTEADFPHLTSKIKVMRDNIVGVVNCYYSFNNPTVDYHSYLNYVLVNNMEKNLEITNTLLLKMISEFRYCGSTICNQSLNL